MAEEVVETPSAKLRRAFQTLGLEQDGCTPEAIRKAYITLAKKYHPDSTTLEADTDKFVSVKLVKKLVKKSSQYPSCYRSGMRTDCA